MPRHVAKAYIVYGPHGDKLDALRPPMEVVSEFIE